MIPLALSGQLERGIRDFLRLSFWSSTPGMECVIERLLATDGAVLKGPYVSLKLPFRAGARDEPFPAIPLGFPPHLHQERAFQRISQGRSTIVATGTGSGKTECFLWPILDHCRRHAGEPGIKAILVYPMNALASDQALRIARAVQGCDALRGKVRAGIYVGESPGEKRSAEKSMGPEHVISDRTRMQLDPPDILLTNYKMLDYLLARPSDQALWQHNRGTEALRFLVVDELHSFDGAQGTDLACLLRRLKASLGADDGSLCCVGTSATLGGDGPDERGSAARLLEYAGDVFGASFDTEAVITESRQSPEELFAGHLIDFAGAPSTEDRTRLDPSTYPSPDEFLTAQHGLWFDERIAEPPGSDAWRVALGEQLLRHGMLRNVVTLLAAGPSALGDLAEGIARSSRALRDSPALARAVLTSLLSLVSEARAWRAEDAEARAARETAGRPRPTRPLLEVRVQIWQRELTRMVASVEATPTLRYSDDLTDAQRASHLPMVHCRDCGALGWAALVLRDRPDEHRTSLTAFYPAFFSDDPQVRFLWPSEADRGAWEHAPRYPLRRDSLRRVHDEEVDPETVVDVVVSENRETTGGKQRLSRDCPFCEARGSLTLLGFRASTLTAVYVDQLFASAYNDDKKLLAFSDSVQDAAHRAGFFGARTWRFNLRVALEQLVMDCEGRRLDELPEAFAARWRRGDDVAYVATFLPPNLDWLPDYETMLETGTLPEDGGLLADVAGRIAFEIFSEFGHQARIGRSLPRTGCATVAVDADALDAAVAKALPVLQNEVGGLRDLGAGTLRRFLLGTLHHLRERGGIHHRELPDSFLETAGDDLWGFNRPGSRLPHFGRTSRLPALLTTDVRSKRFDVLIPKRGGKHESWYERWVRRCFSEATPLMAEPRDIWEVVLPELMQAGLLVETAAKRGHVWGVPPSALLVRGATARMRCQTCKHWMIVADTEATTWTGMPCLTARCDGRYDVDLGPGSDAVDESPDYFGRLYRLGEVERVFPAEHTGLLPRGVREELEQRFKADGAERKPWYPNLLSSTPTLEMGVDIGSLSSAILCSVPPSQANYLQRVGRAGRRDGNALLVTIAGSRPHDLYFYAVPEEMIRGDVQPPGVFLNASAVLERQLAAYTLDRWNVDGGERAAIPAKLRDVFAHLDDPGPDHFPRSWLGFVEGREDALLEGFFALFGERLGEGARAHLRSFLLGDQGEEGSLAWKVLDALASEQKQCASFRSSARKLKAIIDEMKAAEARDKDHDAAVEERVRERQALLRLVREIEGTLTLEFLTNQGLLPNYAFPESPVRLRSVVWRKRKRPAEDGSAYETRSYEYARPAMTAISELAPENRFFAGGRAVKIDQVDVATAKIETWRFCSACTYSMRVDIEDPARDCPACASPVWGEESQRRQLLRLTQVYANTNDRLSRIRDEQEERQPRFYERDMMPTFQDADRRGAWRIDDDAMPFAFEYYERASFREINFGEPDSFGSPYSIAGQLGVRRGFVICRHCGKVQSRAQTQAGGRAGSKGDGPQHALWCPARKKDADAPGFQAAVYLYREFASEALRMLLPLSEVSSDRQLHSFVAAFQLGLRERYGGRVDHLRTLVYSEPEPGSHVQRRYLVLYDTVPGGTGYLKDFTVAPEPDAAHPIFEILERALARIRSCTCAPDPERDGCYRCLFAYRNSRDMSETSASEAAALLGAILERREQIVEIESLAGVSLSGLMDSVLEARFIEALRRSDCAERPVRVEKRMVRSKPGFRVEVGGQAWNVEQQLDLGEREGVWPPVSIDFVFHPTDGDDQQRSLAVFLDGFQYHRHRIGRDLLQRMGLVRGGSYEVWTFTWWDVEPAFKAEVEAAPFLVHPDAAQLDEVLGKLRHGRWADGFRQPLLDLFLDDLASPSTARRPSAELAAIALAAQLAKRGEIALGSWVDALRERIPAAIADTLSGLGDDWFLTQRAMETAPPLSLWGAAPPEAVRDPRRADECRLVVRLDDDGHETPDRDARQTWRGLLRLFHHFQPLPHAWFVASGEVEEHDFARLAQIGAGGPTEGVPDERWAELDVLPAWTAVANALATGGVPVPSVGIDLPDAKGYAAGLVAELAWEEEKVAAVDDLDSEARAALAADWAVFTRSELEGSVAALVAALQQRRSA